jgi:hypothetical protein
MSHASADERMRNQFLFYNIHTADKITVVNTTSRLLRRRSAPAGDGIASSAINTVPEVTLYEAAQRVPESKRTILPPSLTRESVKGTKPSQVPVALVDPVSSKVPVPTAQLQVLLANVLLRVIVIGSTRKF